MKRAVIAVLAAAVALGFCCAYIFGRVLHTENFSVEKIEIADVLNASYDLENPMGTWDNPDIEKCRQVLDNPQDYRLVEVDYRVYNPSEKLEAVNVRAYPQKSDDLVCYTSGDGYFFVNVDLKTDRGFTQRIIVKTLGRTDEEILRQFKERYVSIKYYSSFPGDNHICFGPYRIRKIKPENLIKPK